MFNTIRKIVAGPKKRTVEGDYDLDLTHITDRIIAMAYPASGIQQTYRNPIETVSDYLQKNYKNHYLIINLSMRKYDYSFFENRVKDYFWQDHNAPLLETMFQICWDMYQFLQANENNIVVIHCNHGKGRTGSAIIGLLLFTGLIKDENQALTFYNKRRFSSNTYGVNQPCQMRYLKFFNKLTNGKTQMRPRLTCYKLVNVKQKGLQGNCTLSISFVRNGKLIHEQIPLDCKFLAMQKAIMADVLFQIYQPGWLGQQQKSRANFNMQFLDRGNGEDELFILRLNGKQIKISNKSTGNFELILQFVEFCDCHNIPIDTQIKKQCKCAQYRQIEDTEWQKAQMIKASTQKLRQQDNKNLIFGNLDIIENT